LKLALRLFDPHYDGRSIYPRLIVFPMADEDGGWGAAQAQIVIKLIEAYRGTVPAVPDRSLALHGS
jgi:hypothetical protein